MPSSRSLFRLFLGGFLLGSLGIQVLSVRLGDSPQLIVSDGKCYYAWVRSALLDGDLQFRNDYEMLSPPDPPPPEYGLPTPRSDASNKYPIGLPILEVPGLVVGHLVALSLPGVPADGVSMPYQVAVVGSLLLLALGGIVCLRSAMMAWSVDEGLATVLTIVLVLGTNAIQYLAKEPAMPHAAGLAVTCVILWVISRPPARPGPGWGGRELLLGGLLGLLLLIRNSNVALLPFLAAAFLSRRRDDGRWWLIPVGTAAVVALQPLSLYLLWGDLRLSTYSNEGFTGAPWGFLASLFDPRHGLFLYSPWYLVLLGVGVAGAVRSSGARTIALAAIASFLGLVLINGSWWCWWFGASFGNRGYIEILPVLTLSAGIVLTRMPPPRWALRAGLAAGAVACVLNLALWAGYLLQRYSHEGPIAVGDAYGWMFR